MKNANRFALAGILLLAVACKGTPSIEGDLSIEGAKGAYRPVMLVRNGDSLMASVDAICEAEKADIAARADKIKMLNETADRMRLLPARTQMAEVARGDSVDKYRQAANAEERTESLRGDTAGAKISALIKQATDTQVTADENGHFKFGKLKPGVYVLYVEWLRKKGDKQFFAKVDATTKGKKTQNLDEAAVTTRLHCR